MRSRRYIGVMSIATVLLMVMAAFAAVPGAGTSDGKTEYVVLFKDTIDEQVVKDNNGKINKAFSLIPAVVTKITAKDAKNLEKSDNVKAVEENYIYYAAPGKSQKKPQPPPPEPDPQVTPWGVDRIDAEEAWTTTKGDGITVAVIDTGIDKDHPDLETNIIGGRNYVVIKRKIDPNKWDDDNGHGTHCAGIIAALDNDEGVVGVAPGASLYAIKVLNKRGSGFMSDVIAGIEHATYEGVDVISMSLSGPDSTSLADAVAAAISGGIVVVAAAGNYADDPVEYPAYYTGVIGVGATASTDVLASFSNYGVGLDIVAPGVAIYSTYKGGGYTTMSGTSMACPHVAGTVALVLASGGSVDDIYDTADWPTYYSEEYYGNGLLDAEEAVTGYQTGDN